MSLSKYGMRTSVWGPPGWVFIESVVQAYPRHPSSAKQKRYAKWIHLLKYVLPCSICCNNMKRHLRQLGWKQNLQYYLANRHSLVKLIHKLHNMVNVALGKQIQRKQISKSTCAWGPSAWLFIGCVVRNYPVQPTKEEQCRYGRWLNGLKYVLPDKDSRKNMKYLMQVLQWHTKKWEYLLNRDNLSRFIHLLHNSINAILHKPTVDYDSFITLFDSFRAKCDPNTDNNVCEEDVFSTFEPMKCLLNKGVIQIEKSNNLFRFGVDG